jgi:quinol-cytochrome oxidoreductase complex cytochrome b subunit
MTNKSEQKFYPDYLFEIVLVIFLTIEIVIILAMLYPQGIGRLIDFTSPYQPLPEWYFLWLYQLVRYFPGEWAFVGTIVLPIVAIFLLGYLPWIDRGRWGRAKALIVSAILLLSFVILTIIPLVQN